jgi:hypothetical protein
MIGNFIINFGSVAAVSTGVTGTFAKPYTTRPQVTVGASPTSGLPTANEFTTVTSVSLTGAVFETVLTATNAFYIAIGV